eukprot:scaffold208463_cov20-Tisochrysis_lutea.AAC.1
MHAPRAGPLGTSIGRCAPAEAATAVFSDLNGWQLSATGGWLKGQTITGEPSLTACSCTLSTLVLATVCEHGRVSVPHAVAPYCTHLMHSFTWCVMLQAEEGEG